MYPLLQPVQRHKEILPALALVCLTIFLSGMTSAPKNTLESENLADILELRGYTRIGGVLEFSIYNKQEKRSEWLQVDREHLGYKIESYDSERNEIVIEYNGLREVLPLQTSQIIGYAAPSTPPAPAASNAGAQPVQAPGATARSRRDNPGHFRTDSQRSYSPEGRTSSSRNRSTRGGESAAGQGGFTGRGRSQPPPTGGNQGPGNGDNPGSGNPGSGNPSSGNPDPGDTGAGGSYWDTMQSPPPVPSIPPPAYSPEQ